MTAKNEASNVSQDLAAGFSKVLIACRNGAVKRAVENSLTVLPDEHRAKTTVIQLCEFKFVNEMLSSKRA